MLPRPTAFSITDAVAPTTAAVYATEGSSEVEHAPDKGGVEGSYPSPRTMNGRLKPKQGTCAGR